MEGKIFSYIKAIRKKLNKKLVSSEFFKKIIIYSITKYLQFVYLTNRPLAQSEDPHIIHQKYKPFIITFWHGRHIMGPFLRPQEEIILAMFSRSKDAEINACIGKNLGLEIVRGSGGREQKYNPEKGGARALLTLKNALKHGKNTAMIADIAHGKPREAGKGIILLAKLSGRPIIPYVYAFSREKIFKKTWDQTAIPLPFGRSVFLTGESVFVPQEADEALIEQKRIELTKTLNTVLEKAYKLLDTEK